MMLFDEAKLPTYILAHLISRNAAIGIGLENSLDDVLYAYHIELQWINFKELEPTIKAIQINTKCLALQRVITTLRLATDINEKRGYLIDALNLEREINEILYGIEDNG